MQIYPDNLFEKIGFEAIRQRLSQFAVSELSKEWLTEMRPIADLGTVKAMLMQLLEMRNLHDAEEYLPYEQLPDIRQALSRAAIEGSVLPTYQFNDLGHIAKAARLCDHFIGRRSEDLPQISQITKQLQGIQTLEKAISKIISEEGEVRSNASAELVKIRRQLNQRRSELRSVVQRVMKKALKDGMSDEGSVTIRDGRMVIPVKAEYKRKVNGFVHDTSSTGQTVYLEPVEALHINNDIRELERAERKEIERILRELTTQVRGYIPILHTNFEILSELDVIKSKAQFSQFLNAEICFPSEKKAIRLFDALNPHLLLSSLKKAPADREKLIPLFLEMNPEEKALIITGPNAGGKSVAMKTVGLFSCMLQSGLALPAREDSQLPIFKSIFVDLGDNQSVENDLSTFSSRLKWMKECTDYAGKNSLILIDEAGAGTDPDEGSALYQALAEELLERGAHVFITTHHGALKVFAEEHPKAINGSMEFSQERLEPTYRFRKGVPGSSYGFEISRRMFLPDSLIKRARSLVGEGKSKIEHLIVSLEGKEQQAAILKNEYESLTKKLNNQRSDYETKLKSLRKKSDEIKEKALVEAKRIVDHANQRVEKAVEEALRVAQSKEEADKARKGIKKLKSRIGGQLGEIENRKADALRAEHGEAKVGDRVRLADGLTFGELAEINGKQAVVSVNGLRLKTKYSNLVRVEKSPTKVPKSPKKGYKLTVADADPDASMVSLRLDLRGKRGEEAIYELKQYLDRVILAGFKQVEIVHGKGNGVLKGLVHQQLSAEESVFHFELAPEDQGGSGCTVVALR